MTRARLPRGLFLQRLWRVPLVQQPAQDDGKALGFQEAAVRDRQLPLLKSPSAEKTGVLS